MRLRALVKRPNVVCPAGTLFYTCEASNYKGCCSVNACDYDGGCPAGSSGTPPSGVNKAPPTATTSPATPPTTLPATTPTTAPTTTTTTHSSTSSAGKTSSTSSSSSAASGSTASGLASNGSPGQPASSSDKLSKGAIGGIVAGGVLVFLLIAALIVWRLRRRDRKQLRRLQQQLDLAAETAAAGAASGSPGSSPNGNGNGNGPGAQARKEAHFWEKLGKKSSRTPGIMAAGFNPSSPTTPLFGEAPGGNVEASIARWGLRGARLAAKRRMAQHGSLRSQDGGTSDLGGSYLGPGGDMPDKKYPTVPPPIAELDDNRASSAVLVAELETPAPTPPIGSYSPPIPGSGTSSQSGGRSTFVSSWRSSGPLVGGGNSAEPITEENTPELDSTPRMAGPAAQLPGNNGGGGHYYEHQHHRAYVPVPTSSPPLSRSPQGAGTPGPAGEQAAPRNADTPRATLDVTHTERTKGLHVASWGLYHGP
ncbi:hypothetical protein SPI_09221 [Niveomyces insectorum RCEF 264]|uniref:Uncharacterized protein n=1 Tax=Niveomyces insectorum RCEF 264 TaxID=1081102 RepID=A0A167M0U1_9HYPO|nr:hypothetical protein SPI_09221 [Niveomyces insectorum RCEF 264]